jgi:hypothetical protein
MRLLIAGGFLLFSLLNLNNACLAQNIKTNTAPLTEAEKAAAFEEIKYLTATEHDKIADFPVRVMVPDFVTRFLNSPEFATYPTEIKAGALTFAGKANLLRFEKPSDIWVKMQTWFPAEIAEDRSKDRWISPFFKIVGPFPDWGDESLAFMTLWNCLPQGVWYLPEQSLYKIDAPNIGNARFYSSVGPYDFAYCAHEQNGRVGTSNNSFHASQKPKSDEQQAKWKDLAARIGPVLNQKFDRYLNHYTCADFGADDCLLILHMWARLSPDDKNLAKHIQTLVGKYEITAASPVVDRSANASSNVTAPDKVWFHQLTARSAWLSAKLASNLFAPQAWENRALSQTLHEISLLQQSIDFTYYRDPDYFKMERVNASVSPWFTIARNINQNEKLKATIESEIDTVKTSSCNLVKDWFFYSGPEFKANYIIKHFDESVGSECLALDWNWLYQEDSQEAKTMRSELIARIGDPGKFKSTVQILDKLTGDGSKCFEGNDVLTKTWLKALCETWVEQPLHVPTKLMPERLPHSSKVEFQKLNLRLPEDKKHEGVIAAHVRWLNELVKDKDANSKNQMQMFARELQRDSAQLDWAVE